jgi:hypothetical protein
MQTRGSRSPACSNGEVENYLTPSIDDYRWLLSAAAEPWIVAAGNADTLRGGELVRLVQQLRKTLSPPQAHLIVELAELRRRARAKFTAADRMYFTRVGLEQATDEQISKYKATRFRAGSCVADLCCGIGGDLIALASRGATLGVDASDVLSLIASRNAEATSSASATVQTCLAQEIPVGDFGAWHIDPDRRPSGKRTTRVELHEPPLEALERMLADNREGAIKLAPAAEVPQRWQQDAECEWLGSRGECRQLMVWHGQLARSPGRRVATVVDAGTEVRRMVGDDSDEQASANRISRFVYEPHATVLAAKVSATLAREHGLQGITRGVAYLTGDERIDDTALDGFEVLDVLPLDVRQITAWLAERNIGPLEVKKRGVEADPLALQKKLQSKREISAVLLLMPIAGRATAVMAQRLGESSD